MLTFGEAAHIVGGEWVGGAQSLDGQTLLGLAPLDEAQQGQLSFVGQARLLNALGGTQASAILLSRSLRDRVPPNFVGRVLLCDDALFAAAQVQAHINPCSEVTPEGIDPSAVVHPDSRVHPTARIGPLAVVMQGATIGPLTQLGPQTFVGQGATLGSDCRLHPQAKVLWGCQLGDRVILQPGSVVGSDGFGYAQVPNSAARIKMPQVGRVILEDDVEIGANTTIDRATFGTTRLGRGTKVDNLVQLAHNVQTGEDCVVVSQSGIAGSTTLGARVIVGAQVGVVGHIKIADGVVLAARTGVAGAIDTSGVYAGAPAMPHRQWLKAMVAVKQLPDLLQRWRRFLRSVENSDLRPSS